MMRRGLLFLAIFALTASCTLTPRNTGAAHMFILKPAEVSVAATAAKNLTVALPQTSSVLDTARVALTRNGKFQDYYADARWADFLPVLVRDNLAKTLSRTAVAGAAGGHFILKTEIRVFQAEYAAGSLAPVIRIRMNARLVSLEKGEVLSFTAEVTRKAEHDRLSDIQTAFAAAFNDVQKQIAAKVIATKM